MTRMIVSPSAVKRFIPLVLFIMIVAACGGTPADPGTTGQAPAASTADAQTGAQPTAAAAAAGTGGSFEMRALLPCDPPVGQVFDVLLKNFSTTHPNVKINKECFPSGTDYGASIFADAAANNLPDIIFSADIFTAPFVDAGALLDVEEYAKSDTEFKLDDVYPSILGLGRVEGQPGLYMIPVSLDTVQMYYNKTMWQKSGAPMPTDKWTWDDLVSACQTVQKSNQGVKCLGIGTKDYGFDWWAYWVPWIRGYGGDVLSADGKTSTLTSPEAMAGLQAYTDLWAKDDIAFPPGTDTIGSCFISQKCAVVFHTPGNIKNFQEKIGSTFEWDVQYTPSHPKGHYTGMGTYGFSIAKTTQHPKEAWDFVKYLASPDGQRIITSSQLGVPLLKSLANDPVVQQLKPPPANMAAFIHGGDIGIFPRTYPVACGSLYSGQVNTVIKNALEQVIRKAATVQQAFQSANDEIQACLSKGK